MSVETIRKRQHCVNETAEIFGVTADTVRRWIRSGLLGACDLTHGSSRPIYRISDEDIDAFVAGGRTHTLVPKESA